VRIVRRARMRNGCEPRCAADAGPGAHRTRARGASNATQVRIGRKPLILAARKPHSYECHEPATTVRSRTARRGSTNTTIEASSVCPLTARKKLWST